jgi:hypothetical protein
MFKNLKSLFIEETDDGSKKVQVEKQQSTGKAEKEKLVAQPAPKVSLKASSGKVTSKFMEILFKAMEDNDLEGFDYLEFKQSLKSLEKMPMDEQTRFKSAFAMAQTMDATPAHLIKTASHYLNILKQEEKKFEDALTHQRAKQIGDKEQQLAEFAQEVKNKEAQIKKMTQEIEKHQKAMDRIKQEVAKASIKVESTKNDFVASYNLVVSQITKDIENMKRFFK